jgi:DNA-binding CsgD family transcriptional regulator
VEAHQRQGQGDRDRHRQNGQDLPQFHVPTLFAAPEDGEFRAYAERWRRKVHLGTAIPEPSPGGLQWMSLYRRSDEAYSESQRLLCESLMGHFAEALRINRAIGQTRPPISTHATAAQLNGLAMTDFHGRLHFAQAAFLQLIRREWLAADDLTLPSVLSEFIERNGGGTFVGRVIRCDVRGAADLYLIEARPKSTIDDLPPQRARITALFASGHSYKAIANQLHIAPSTVRNQIAAAYRNLGITSKEELLRIFRAHGR